jgi:hypothetical protein
LRRLTGGSKTILLIVLVALSVVGQFLPARAAGTLTISPSRTQEGNPSGVTFTLSVGGATIGQNYQFYWAVVDPYGRNYTVTTSLKAPSSNYILTEVFPRDFGPGAGIAYVGQYSVAVFQTAPSVGLAGAGQFGIGITDKVLYERTQVVSIRAAGYNANDMVTIYVTNRGVSAPGFPQQVRADASGNIAASWLTTASTLTGNYTVSLSGTSTMPKNPPDSQWFIIVAANLGVIPNVVSTSGNILAISTLVTEPDQTSFTLGNVTGQFYMSGTSIGGTIRLVYDQAQGNWTGSYSVQSSDPSGLWVLQVTASDSYGNNGEGSTFLSVTPPPPPPPQPPPAQNLLTSFWYLWVLAVIGTGALMGFAFSRRKRLLPPHLQVDSKAVETEAQRFMGADFFKSIRKQLEKKKGPVQGEKDG